MHDDGLIDTNVWLSAWPTRGSWAATPRALVAKLRRHGVVSAWTGSFDAALHTDIAGVNARLAEACARDGEGVLVPFGTVNPALPDWEEDLRRCHEVHRMAGLRLLPGHHGYQIDDPRLARLVEFAAQRGLPIQIVCSLEDPRSPSPGLSAPSVPAAPFIDVIKKIPRARAMLLNAAARPVAGNAALLRRFADAGNLALEIATLEGVAGIAALLESAPTLPIAFGSCAPFFYFESALLKLQESPLTPQQLDAVRHGCARGLLAAASAR